MGSFSTTHQITYVSGNYDSDAPFVRTITDGEADLTFETGDGWTDPSLGFEYLYLGTAVVDGATWPVFTFVGFPTYQTIFMDQTPVSIPPTIASASFSSGATFNDACFAAGTLISTPTGEIAVEDLRIGDMIRTAQGRDVPVKWLGHLSFNPLFGGAARMPVCIRANALGKGLPHSDLTVTADHALEIDGLLVNAGALVNDTTVQFAKLSELPETFTVYHIETEAHDVILANGAPSETFIDMVGRGAFDNYQEYLDLYGTERIIPEMRNYRITTQRLLPSTVRARLGLAEKPLALTA